MQPHDDDGDAGDDRELARISAQQAADGARAGAERDEHRGEAEHEQERRDDGLALDARLRLASASRSIEVPVR